MPFHAYTQRWLVLFLAGDKADELAVDYNTIFESLTHKFGAENVRYEPGITYKQGRSVARRKHTRDREGWTAAADVDYIIVCIGENSYVKRRGT